ncbi:MAG: hypothetical protein EA390_05125 [Balneolaceae bacterium]|nr:MAG: hypothetical protein EA390_05125 [Balneolaceae bacterium]
MESYFIPKAFGTPSADGGQWGMKRSVFEAQQRLFNSNITALFMPLGSQWYKLSRRTGNTIFLLLQNADML